LFTIAALVSLTVGATSHVLGPMANKALQVTLFQARQDLIALVLQPGRFTSPEPRLTIHIRDRNADGTLLGLLIHDARDEKLASSYLAERAVLVRQEPAAFLMMSNGHIIRRNAQTNGTDVVAFDRYTVDINRFEQKADQGVVLRPRERTTAELLTPDPEDHFWKTEPGRYRAEIHDRFSGMLIALAFVGQAQTTRQSRMAALIGAIALGFACRMLAINATNQAATKASAVAFQYAIPIVTGLAMVALMVWASRPRPPLRRSFARAARA
jgi:lipopolysaccharide export system permease protein